VFAKTRCAPLLIKKALGMFRELIRAAAAAAATTTTIRTRVAFWSKNLSLQIAYMM